MAYQKTIKKEISFTGIGLHTGKSASVTLRPAPVYSGITFVRKDLEGHPEIPGTFKYVRSTYHATTIGLNETVQVHTIEHLMAAFAGLNIDNVRVEVSGSEIPIMDGSANPFFFLLECAGIQEQEAIQPYVEILAPVEVSQENRKVSLEPCPFGLVIDVDITFRDRPEFSTQSYTYQHTPERFKREIAQARTFGFAEEVEYLHNQGLALGGSLKNAVIFQEGNVLNEEGLRFENECARHKALDVLGDLYLFGYPIKGRFKGFNCGHGMDYLLLQKLFETPKAWRVKETKNTRTAGAYKEEASSSNRTLSVALL